MKKRNGFVSNSSSSSFVINKKNLSATQLEQIYDHVQCGEKFGIACADSNNEWSIHEEGEEILGSTSMDNFDMQEFFHKIGVQSKFVRWGDGYSGHTYEREYEDEFDGGLPSWVKNIEYECPNCNNSFWGKPLVAVKCCPYCAFEMS